MKINGLWLVIMLVTAVCVGACSQQIKEPQATPEGSTTESDPQDAGLVEYPSRTDIQSWPDGRPRVVFLHLSDASGLAPMERGEWNSVEFLTISGIDCDMGEPCWMLNEVPDAILKMPRLRGLQIVLHNIQHLGPKLRRLEALNHLTLVHQYNLDLGSLVEISQLDSLVLVDCRLRDRDSAILGRMDHLSSLVFEDCSLSEQALESIRNSLPSTAVSW